MNNNKVKNIAIIFAGGVGQRFGSEIPKQFVKVYGKEIIVHTLEVFQKHPEIDEIYIGCVEEWIPYLAELVVDNGINKVPNGGILPGGSSGQDTIYKILKRARENNSDDDIVLIHDGVRPIVTANEISENISSVKANGSTITCKKFTATPVCSIDGKVVTNTIARETMFEGVAPQSFYLGHILEAHEKIRAVTDDYEGMFNGTTIVDSASLIQAAFNEKCNIVIGNPNNMKVTNMYDFFALLGILQASDVSNYFMAQNMYNFQPNSALVYSKHDEIPDISTDADQKIYKLGGENCGK